MYPIDDLTPPAILDLINNEYGGGMVQAIIIGVEVVTSEGERRNLFTWDSESSITIQIGLAKLLSQGIDLRALDAFVGMSDFSEDDEDE